MGGTIEKALLPRVQSLVLSGIETRRSGERRLLEEQFGEVGGASWLQGVVSEVESFECCWTTGGSGGGVGERSSGWTGFYLRM